MGAPQAVAAGAVLATVLSCVLAGLLVWAGPVDAPHERGLHERPTTTSGGIAVMAGVGLGVVALGWLAPAPLGGLRSLAAATGFAALLGVIGACDDLFDFGAAAKLAAQAAVALLFAATVARIQALPLGLGASLSLPAFVGIAGTALWLVVAGNAVNFMDGANGLAPGAIVIALLALATACLASGMPAAGGLALVGAGAGAGLLPWNLRGLLFQGDAGALFSSFLFAALSVIVSAGPGRLFLYFGPLLLLPLLTDVLLTLAVRALGRRPLMQAHREHLYQLWLQRDGRPHLALAWRVWLIMALAATAALSLQHAPVSVQPLAFALAVAVCALSWAMARRRVGRSAADV